MKSIQTDTARHSVIKCLVHLPREGEKGRLILWSCYIELSAVSELQSAIKMEMLTMVISSVA